MNVLDLFINDPDKFCYNNALFIENFRHETEDKNFKMGGSIHLDIKDVGNNVYKATVKNYEEKNKKYYFVPYASTGCCIVPKETPIGTLVFTPLMNGCSLYVKETAEGYLFYHDVNDQLFGKEPTQNFCCKIINKDYAMPLNIGFKLAKEKTNKQIKYTFGHSLVSIKMTDKWRVYVMGVLIGYDEKKYQYEHFIPTVSNCITSFL